MLITRIEKENAEYFTQLCPQEILDDEKLLRLGVVDDEDGDEPVSVCAVDVADSRACIRWLYTDPAKRELGAASLLLDKLESLSGDINLSGIEISFDSDDEELEDLLEDHDFLTCTDTGYYRVSLEDLIYGGPLEEMMESREGLPETYSLSDLRDSGKVIEKLSLKYNIDPSVFKGISPVFSVVTLDKDKNVTSGILVSEKDRHYLYINYLVSEGSITNIYGLFSRFYDVVVRMKRTDSELVFSDRSGDVIRLVESLTRNDADTYRISGLKYAIKLLV